MSKPVGKVIMMKSSVFFECIMRLTNKNPNELPSLFKTRDLYMCKSETDKQIYNNFVLVPACTCINCISVKEIAIKLAHKELEKEQADSMIEDLHCLNDE